MTKDTKSTTKLSIKKDTLKDLKIQPKKEGDVKGGAGRYVPTRDKTAVDPNCPC